MATKRLPPFAGQIPADRASVCIAAGPRAWEMGRIWKEDGLPGLVLPPGDDPNAYAWPITGRNVALIALDLDEPTLFKLVAALAAERPGVLAVLHGSSPRDTLEILH